MLTIGLALVRKIALDIGSKRIGIAITDETNTLARPLTTIERSNVKTEAKMLTRIIKENEVDIIVAGMPVDLKGAKGVAAQNIEEYLEKLDKLTDTPIIRYDERFTTKIAEDFLRASGLKKGKRKKIIDEAAATIILQNYLEHAKKNQA